MTDENTRVKAVQDAIFFSEFGMHTRDFYAVARAIEEHLGTDTLAEQQRKDWDALSGDEQARIEASGNLGVWGLSYLCNQKEVPLALSVVATELSSDFHMAAEHRKALSKPFLAVTVTDRFPKITPDRIAAALNRSAQETAPA